MTFQVGVQGSPTKIKHNCMSTLKVENKLHNSYMLNNLFNDSV